MNFCSTPLIFLNSLELSVMPRYTLELKSDSTVTFLRNLNSSQGLLNGITLIDRNMYGNCLGMEIVTGKKSFATSNRFNVS